MELNLALLAIPVGLVVAVLVYLLLSKKGGVTRIQCQLVQKIKLTHDTIIFTFTLPNPKKSLGLKVGEHVEIEQIINGETVRRKYTPISAVNHVGSFQLLLKIYHPDEAFPTGGKMSSYLEAFPLNQKVTFTLPYGRFNYVGKSITQITSLENQVTKKKFDTLYMVAGGTGITPIYQIIQHACQNEEEHEKPNLILLFANRSQHDILLEKNLRDYAAQKKNKLAVYFSVDKSVTEDWKEFVGFVDEKKISETVPKDINNTLFLSCGPPILSNIVQKIWVSKLKVPMANIHRF